MRVTQMSGRCISGHRTRLLLATVLCLLLVWSTRYFPTEEGPRLLSLATTKNCMWDAESPANGIFRPTTTTLAPSNAILGVLSLLLRHVSPWTSEKILVTVYVVAMVHASLFLLRCVSPAGRHAYYYFPLCLLLVFNRALFKGFYAHCLAMPVVIWAVSVAYRTRDQGNAVSLSLVTFLLTALYFIDLGMCCLAIGFVLITLSTNCIRNRIAFISLVPAVVLAVFWLYRLHAFSSRDTYALIPMLTHWWSGHLSATYLLDQLKDLQLELFEAQQLPSLPQQGLLLTMFLIWTAVLSYSFKPPTLTRIRRWCRTRWRVGGVGLCAVILYFVLPNSLQAHGSYIHTRVAVFPVLFAIAGLRPPTQRIRPLVSAGMYIFVLLNFGLLWTFFVNSGKELAVFSEQCPIPPGSVVYSHEAIFPNRFINIFRYAGDRVCVHNNCVNVNLIHASFPTSSIRYCNEYSSGHFEQRHDRLVRLAQYILTFQESLEPRFLEGRSQTLLRQYGDLNLLQLVRSHQGSTHATATK